MKKKFVKHKSQKHFKSSTLNRKPENLNKNAKIMFINFFVVGLNTSSFCSHRVIQLMFFYLAALGIITSRRERERAFVVV